jgi:hypothetical protein
MEWVLQKGTELGVAEFWPFQAGRSVPILDDEDRAASRADRWRKIAQGAAAQCGRADVPVVHAVCEFATAVDYGTSNGSRCFMLDELSEADALREALRREPLQWDEDGSVPARVMIMVGPKAAGHNANANGPNAMCGNGRTGTFGAAHRDGSAGGDGGFAMGSRGVGLKFGCNVPLFAAQRLIVRNKMRVIELTSSGTPHKIQR